MTIDRRSFLKQTAAAFAAVPFLTAGAASADGFRELTARKTKVRLADPDGPTSDLWGYDGKVPGPVIRAKRGETLRIRFRNELDEPTSVHWHGIRIDNAMDGVSGLTQEAVKPGDSFDYVFTVPDAGTYWYHAHNKSWNEVARGLYGLLVVDEDEPLFAPEADISFVLDDWLLDDSGRFDAASLGNMMDWSHGGRTGNRLTVNGVSRPDVVVETGRWYRIRLVNACNSRILYFDPNRIGAKVIAYDGQPVGEARKLGYSPHLIGPAQRVDLVLTFNRPGAVPISLETEDKPYPFATFRVAKGREAAPALPAIPAPGLPVPDLAAAKHFKLLMEGGAMGRIGHLTYEGKPITRQVMMQTRRMWGFNGITNFPDEPFFSVRRGETVVIDTVNQTAFPHAMHTHGHHFQVIDRSGSEVAETPWRDTFLIGPEQTTRIAFVADNPGKWLYHCHMLEHAAAGMTTWFEVT
ncbi:FtsP/CotA-like multicopper oxidase with cupredoxin domain [Rhodobium orientis]|uniref:Copper oxidase n=1 Tax=Rhodobium orientis TaxID=34017 RepID=A0A327JTV5_9HYPH|nr:multicopper oxidase family protein [Rhodobium orientis]MBB4303954.1 FtsP/CotA-like multicopper oxidase with cupredoxin domain [Rhodobium orientis]MBK5950834.1 copper oxidase [Rhodobium orientis]RAI29501.1 copper oxidase [Rhodobium orientis]